MRTKNEISRSLCNHQGLNDSRPFHNYEIRSFPFFSLLLESWVRVEKVCVRVLLVNLVSNDVS